MRVSFPRLPEHQRAYALVERDDGVCYRLYGGTDPFPGPQLPHDLRHLIAERELGITDGIWAAIAAGVVLGRTKPARRAELLADLVECVAVLDHPTPAQIRRLAGIKLAAWPDADPDADTDTDTDADADADAGVRRRRGGGPGGDRRGGHRDAGGGVPVGAAAGRRRAQLPVAAGATAGQRWRWARAQAR